MRLLTNQPFGQAICGQGGRSDTVEGQEIAGHGAGKHCSQLVFDDRPALGVRRILAQLLGRLPEGLLDDRRRPDAVDGRLDEVRVVALGHDLESSPIMQRKLLIVGDDLPDGAQLRHDGLGTRGDRRRRRIHRRLRFGGRIYLCSVHSQSSLSGSVNRPRQGSRLGTGRAAVLSGTNPRPAGHRRHAQGPESMKSRGCAPRAWLWGRILTRAVAILLRLFWTEKASLHPSTVSRLRRYQLVHAVLSSYSRV